LDVPQRTPQAFNNNLFALTSLPNNSIFFIESPEYTNECFQQQPNSQPDPSFDFSEFFVPPQQQASPLSSQHYSPQSAHCDQSSSLTYSYDVSSTCGSATTPNYDLDNVHSPFSTSSGYHSISPSSTSSEKTFYEMVDEIVEEVRSEIRAESIICGNSNEPKFVARKAPKRKFSYESQFPSSSSENSPISSEYDETQVEQKRGKKFSLAGLSHEEIALRKKEQNRIAAQRYRSKKTHAFHSEVSEIDYLTKRNVHLKQEEVSLAAEIQQLKDLMVAQLSSSLSQK